MSTLWSVRQAFRTAIVQASGLPSSSIVWVQAGLVVADPIIKLSLISDVSSDSIRTELISAQTDLHAEYTQQREARIQVAVESINDASEETASSLLGRIRLALKTQAAKALLDGVQVGDLGPSREAVYRTDGRVVHSWLAEATIRYATSLVDPTLVGTIETLIVGGTLDGEVLEDITVAKQ